MYKRRSSLSLRRNFIQEKTGGGRKVKFQDISFPRALIPQPPPAPYVGGLCVGHTQQCPNQPLSTILINVLFLLLLLLCLPNMFVVWFSRYCKFPRSSLPATETNPERKMAIVLCPLQHTCKFFLPTLNWGGNSFWGCCWGVISTSRNSKSSWKFETKILLFAGKCLNWGQWSLWKEELRKGFQGEVIRSGCRG